MKQTCCEKCVWCECKNLSHQLLHRCTNFECFCHFPQQKEEQLNKELTELVGELKRVLGDLEVADGFIGNKEIITFQRLAILLHKTYFSAYHQSQAAERKRLREVVEGMEKEIVDKSILYEERAVNGIFNGGYNKALSDISLTLDKEGEV